ncbi:RHS repeat-associated core domain-containing protein [Vreelandella titanicae]|uniref:RHS repeat-associated core domain-containing protein n=1 Tax=Vreelandella titanicae TaxID=664683 RepID=UPI003808F04B
MTPNKAKSSAPTSPTPPGYADAVSHPQRPTPLAHRTRRLGRGQNQRAVRNVTQPIRFQGQWHDEESGLYYNRHRYYDPQQGRYISQDPIGLQGGTNLYGYVTNPTGAVDPLGLNPAAATAVVSTIPGSTSESSRAQEAKRLTAAHRAAAGARSLPGYGGNCTPDEYDELARQQDEACNRTKGLGMCDRNDIGYGRAELFDACAQARINIARRCFA